MLLQVQPAVTRALLPRQLTASSSSCEKGACNQGKRLDDSVGGTTTSSSRSDSSSTSCAMLLAYHTATRMPSIASPVCALQRQHLYFFLPSKASKTDKQQLGCRVSRVLCARCKLSICTFSYPVKQVKLTSRNYDAESRESCARAAASVFVLFYQHTSRKANKLSTSANEVVDVDARLFLPVKRVN